MPDNTQKIRSLIVYFGDRHKMAEQLKISYSHVGHLLYGRRNVTPALALRIEKATGKLFTRQEFIW